MTKRNDPGYDPLAYGTLRLGGQGDEKSVDSAPEDTLFEPTAPAEAVFGGDPSDAGDWELLQSDIEELLPGGGPATSPASAAPQAGVHAAPTAAGSERAAAPARTLGAPAQAENPPVAAAPRAPRPRPPVAMPPRRQASSAAILTPAIIFSMGLGVGAYTQLIVGNQVLAGVAAALGVIGALFSWVLLRR